MSMIGPLWTVTFGTSRMGQGGLRPAGPSHFLALPNATAHPSTASVPTSHYLPMFGVQTAVLSTYRQLKRI